MHVEGGMRMECGRREIKQIRRRVEGKQWADTQGERIQAALVIAAATTTTSANISADFWGQGSGMGGCSAGEESGQPKTGGGGGRGVWLAAGPGLQAHAAAAQAVGQCVALLSVRCCCYCCWGCSSCVLAAASRGKMTRRVLSTTARAFATCFCSTRAPRRRRRLARCHNCNPFCW